MANLNQGAIAQQQLQSAALQQLTDAGYYPGYSNSLGGTTASINSNQAIQAIMNKYATDRQSLGQQIQGGTSNPHSPYYGGSYASGDPSYNLPDREKNHNRGFVQDYLPLVQMASLPFAFSSLAASLGGAAAEGGAAGGGSILDSLANGATGISTGEAASSSLPWLDAGNTASSSLPWLNAGNTASSSLPWLDAGNSTSSIGSYLSNPYAQAAAGGAFSGGVNYSKTHDIGSALEAGGLGAAGSFVGGNIGNALYGPEAGTIGGTFLGQGATNSISSALGSGVGGLLNTGLGQAAGSYAGNNLASSFAPQGLGKQAGNYPFLPQQQDQATLPVSLGGPTGPGGGTGNSPGINNLSGLTSNQQASSLATQGVYGGGNGPQEQAYYGNLLNRQLVGNGGGVSPLSSLSPIEQSYNSKLGFGGAKDSNSLLEMLSKWNPANA